MTLDQLRYFVAAAKYEHINRAAQSFPISASVVSNAVKELEIEFRCELFTREKQRIHLTVEGRKLLDIATGLLSQADNIGNELGATHVELAGHYRIGASHFLATQVLAPVWTELQNKHSALSVEISSQPTWQVVDGILSGRLDFGMGFSPAQHPHLETTPIFQGKLLPVVRKHHPILQKPKSTRYKDLSHFPATMHIASEKIMPARPHPILDEFEISPRITFGFDGDFVALENLRRSDNWCLMIDIVAHHFKKYLEVVPFPGKKEALYTVEIIKHKSRRTDAVMEAAFSALAQAASNFKGVV